MSVIKIVAENELSYTVFGDILSAEPVVFLHGIMGSKKNLFSFAHKFLEKCPQYCAILFDLRNHGESSKNWPPFTVDACARDIAIACEKISIRPTKIVGHSFGGKVALLVAHKLPVNQVWMLDCPIGRIEPKNPLHRKDALSVLDIIDILQAIRWPVPSRRALVDLLLEKHVHNNIAMWMTTNLVSKEHGYELIFNLKDMRNMLIDFINLDGWAMAEVLGKKIEIHVVAAEHGQRLTEEDKTKLFKIVGKNGFFHELKNAGHFVHVDNPNSLIEIMSLFFDHATSKSHEEPI